MFEYILIILQIKQFSSTELCKQKQLKYEINIKRKIFNISIKVAAWILSIFNLKTFCIILTISIKFSQLNDFISNAGTIFKMGVDTLSAKTGTVQGAIKDTSDTVKEIADIKGKFASKEIGRIVNFTKNSANEMSNFAEGGELVKLPGNLARALLNIAGNAVQNIEEGFGEGFDTLSKVVEKKVQLGSKLSTRFSDGFKKFIQDMNADLGLD